MHGQFHCETQPSDGFEAGTVGRTRGQSRNGLPLISSKVPATIRPHLGHETRLGNISDRQGRSRNLHRPHGSDGVVPARRTLARELALVGASRGALGRILRVYPPESHTLPKGRRPPSLNRCAVPKRLRSAKKAVPKTRSGLTLLLKTVTLFFLFPCGLLGSQLAEHPCIEELVIPQFTPLAKNAGSQGEVRVEIRFEVSRTKPDIKISSADVILRGPVSLAMAASRFRPNCAGPPIDLRFRFQTSSGPDTGRTSRISFLPPNIFLIKTDPGPMNGSTEPGR